MINAFIIAIKFLQFNCALMFIINNNYGVKCFSDLLLLEPCNYVLNLIFLKYTHIMQFQMQRK